MIPSEDPSRPSIFRPPQMQSPIRAPRDHKLRIRSETCLDWKTLVVLVTRQCEQGLPLVSIYNSNHSSISGQHHQLSIQAEFYSSPIARIFDWIFEGGKRSLIKTSNVVQLYLFTLYTNCKYETFRIEACHWTSLTLH